MGKSKGSKYHPSNINGRLKKVMERVVNEKKNKKSSIKNIDTSKGDWSQK